MNWYNIFKFSSSIPEYLFHGTNSENLSPKDLRLKNKSINSTVLGHYSTERHGLFLTDNEEFAKQYGKNILKVNHKLKNPAIMNDDLRYEFVDSIDPFKERELWLRAKYAPHDWSFFETELGERFVSFLKGKGYDGAVFDEYAPVNDGEEIGGKTYVAFYNNHL